jgi:hypothetical protein
VDEVVDEPGVTYRVCGTPKGAPVALAGNPTELGGLLDALGVDPDTLQELPTTDPGANSRSARPDLASPLSRMRDSFGEFAHRWPTKHLTSRPDRKIGASRWTKGRAKRPDDPLLGVPLMAKVAGDPAAWPRAWLFGSVSKAYGL